MNLDAVLDSKLYRVATISKTEPVTEALEQMVRGKTDALLVEHNGQPWGLLTTRDLLGCLHRQLHTPEDLLIEEIIPQKLITADIDDPIGATVETMVNTGIAYLPVVREKEVVGVVSLTDLLTIQINTLMSEIKGLESYIADFKTAEMD